MNPDDPHQHTEPPDFVKHRVDQGPPRELRRRGTKGIAQEPANDPAAKKSRRAKEKMARKTRKVQRRRSR